MADAGHCPGCGGPLIRRNRAWLTLWALVIGFAGAIALRAMIWFAPLTLIALAAAAYLLWWALAGGGQWCRSCKRFP